MVFRDREFAAQLLLSRLRRFNPSAEKFYVAAIPRGGVVVGDVIARYFGLPLGAVVVKKIGAPHNPELAIGAVGARGRPLLDKESIKALGVPVGYLKKEIQEKELEAKKREKYLGASLERADIVGKDVFLVDDGLATGQTAVAASKILRSLGASRVILAVPCLFFDVLAKVQENFNDIVFVEGDGIFKRALGQFYEDFSPVDDAKVRKILVKARVKKDNSLV